MAKLSDIKILSIGHTIQMAGAVYVGEGKAYLAMFPDEQSRVSVRQGDYEVVLLDAEDQEVAEVESLLMDTSEWEVFLRQTDLLETEVTARAADGTVQKAIVRKSQRQIEQGVSWKVYKRDRYACRYCANDDTPLTVDHLVTWESGGPSTVNNLVAACRKCNKTRGDLSYLEWLQHPFYRKVSQNLSEGGRQANLKLAETLDSIPRLVHKRTR
jgi:5-methylcytosine-specific restriction endonuclease McrA